MTRPIATATAPAATAAPAAVRRRNAVSRTTGRASTSALVDTAASVSQHRFSRALFVANVLTERIIDGTYAPGERIREAALQQEFGLSNGPVREALQRLVAGGLAIRAPWQGVRVIELREREIIDLFELRAALLEHAAALAARNADAATVAGAAKLRKTLAKKFSAARAGHQPAVTGDTTDWVLAAANSPYISEVWCTTMLKSRIFVYRSMRNTAGAATEPLIHQLIDAILRRDPAAAREAAAALTRQMLLDLGIDRKDVTNV